MNMASYIVVLALLSAVQVVQSQAPPSFDQPINQNIAQNDPLQTVSITGILPGDADPRTLSFLTSTNNNELITEQQVAFVAGSSATSTTFTYRPARGMAGTATVTISLLGLHSSGKILQSTREFTIVVAKTDVDCQYSAWTTWSMCTARCNGGTQSRSRTIARQPIGQGRPCDANSQLERRSCNDQQCLPPTIDQVVDQTVLQGSGSSDVLLTGISAGQGENDQSIRITAHSGNTQLVPPPVIIYHSPSNRGILRYFVNAGQSGTANIVVTLSDTGTNGIPSSYTTTMSFTINVTPTPVDCLYEWTAWSGCSASCGDGTKTRDSRIIRRPNFNGQPCPSPLPIETQTCFNGACPQDCETGWSEWQPCSVTCGSGKAERFEVIQRYPSNGGQACGTLDVETKTCTERQCPVDCVLEWGEWSTCSRTCGAGTSRRTKEVKVYPTNGGKRCESPLPFEERACNNEPCPGANDCHVSHWSEWSNCNISCKRVRNRYVTQPARNSNSCPSLRQEESCSGEDCGNFGGGFGSCQGRCGDSTGNCACDYDCLRWGDCCSDYSRICQWGY